MKKELIKEISIFLSEIINEEEVDFLRLAESFAYSYYANEKFSYNTTITALNYQISDGKFVFSLSIVKDQEGRIIDLEIQKVLILEES